MDDKNFKEILRKDLHQLYLMGAAMQLKRMGYHMTKMYSTSCR